MSEWMDEWNILNIEEVLIDKDDKTENIFQKFEKIWPDLLHRTLNKILEWKIEWIKQNDSYATYCLKITKEDGEVKFKELSAKQIYDKFRAYNTWPWIYIYFNGKKLQIDDCDLLMSSPAFYKDEWEVICLDNKKLWVVCKDKNILILKQVKLEWKKTMDINSFINGNKEFLNYRLN